MEVGFGNGRRTASVVGNADEARVVEIVVAVVKVDVGVGDSERTEVGDLVVPFVLCLEKKGGAFSWDGVSRASCSLPYSEKTLDRGGNGRPELCRSVPPLL